MSVKISSHKIIQIAIFEGKIIALTNTGKIFQRYSNSTGWELLCDSPIKEDEKKFTKN